MSTPTQIDYRYQVLETLGAGLSGEVYQVEGPDGKVALKLLKSEVSGLNQEDLIATFKFEFSLLKDLKHSHVVKIFDFGFDEELKRFYFTQELVEGTSLKAAAKSLSLTQIQQLFIQALQGLAYLDSQGVVHGDIKPENILLTGLDKKEPLLKLIDFGISHPGFVQLAGTPGYMPPEKILKEPVDARGDLYALAVSFYAVLTGKNPFVCEETSETLHAHLNLTAPSATTLRAEIPPLWSELLALMLKKNPRYRIPSAEACLKFLENKGKLEVSLNRDRLIPDAWIGREELLSQAKDFLHSLLESSEKKCLWLVGEPGLGKRHLLTELKYEAELQSIRVITPDEASSGKTTVAFLKEEEIENLLEKNQLLALSKRSSIIGALRPSMIESLPKDLGKEQVQVLPLRPLNAEETRNYLEEITRNPEVPDPFFEALFRLSQGFPDQLMEALRHLVKDPNIVEPSGKWNLAPFHEAEPTLQQLDFSADSLEHVLESQGIEDPKERWQLGFSRSIALANESKYGEALSILKDLEAQAKSLYIGDKRLAKKAELFEKRGWIYTRQHRYQEGREAFASGLSLLSEISEPPMIIKIRLLNLVAFLDLQAGERRKAIAQYKESAKLAQELTQEEQNLITNNELGDAYLANGQYDEAIEQLQKDLENYEKIPNPYLLIKARYNLGKSHFGKLEYDAARENYEKVVQMARQEKEWDYLIRAYNDLANLACRQGDRVRAIDDYQRSLALAEYIKDYLSAANVAQNRGAVLGELKRFEEAEHDLELSKQLLRKVSSSTHSRYLMARAIYELGDVYLQKKDLKHARSCFSEAKSRSEEDENLKAFSFYPLLGLAKLAQREGDSVILQDLYPQLVHLASDDDQKKELAEVMKKVPEAAPPSQVPKAVPEATVPIAALPQVSVPQVSGPQSTLTWMPQSWVPSATFPQEALLYILKINRALIQELDPQALFKRILEYATELSQAETALLLEVNLDNELSVREAFNTTVDSAENEISQQIAQKVLSTGQSIATQDAVGDEAFNQFESVMALNLRSIACIPILYHQKVIGLLYLSHRNQTQLFQDSTLRLLEAFADQAGLAMQNVKQMNQLRSLNSKLQEQLIDAEEFIDQLKSNLRAKVKNPYPKILGKSRAIVDILKTLDRVSDTKLTILILGETGSGKELIARSVHEHSSRRKGPFVAVNCGAIPENLMESELFGYVKGAFTGASRDKKGLLEEANGGTLFLDEVAELPLSLQVKLLRALQEKEIRRVGANSSIKVDLRVVAATHRNIENWVTEEKFREDLYYRLAQMVMTLPSLRERMEDLPLLCDHFLKLSAEEHGLKKAPRLSRDLLKLMMDYPWPGNVRELENMLRTASAFAEKGMIRVEDLPAHLKNKMKNKHSMTTPKVSTPAASHSLKPLEKKFQATQPNTGVPFFADWSWPEYEEALFAKSLIKHGMNAEQAAESLGVGVATVYVKMRKYGLKKKMNEWEQSEISFPEDLTLANLKKEIIQQTYQANKESPYKTAEQLKINVGTVYRVLRS